MKRRKKSNGLVCHLEGGTIGIIVVVVSLILFVVFMFFVFKDAEKRISKCDHENVKWSIVTKKPTCKDEGSKYTLCLDCFGLITKPIATTDNHKWVEKEAKAPTCMEEGREAGLCCSVCNVMQDESKIIEKVAHTIIEQEGIAPTCTASGLTDGAYCEVCQEVIVAQEIISATGHDFDFYANACTVCSEKEYPEIKTINEFSSGWDYESCVVYLDYVIRDDQSNNIILSVTAEDKYIKFVGSADKTYPLIVKIEERSTPFHLDLVNARLKTIGAQAGVYCFAQQTTTIGFYGERSSISAGKANDGSNGSIGLSGGKGDDGCAGVLSKGDIIINVNAETCSINGGAGGNGGKGSNGSIGNNGMGNGGNGGAGSHAIEASSITVNIAEGYTKENISIIAGSGGSGGAGGEPGWLGDQYGAPGRDGYTPQPTNITITYIEETEE